jgi:hypothetical protein
MQILNQKLKERLVWCAAGNWEVGCRHELLDAAEVDHLGHGLYHLKKLIPDGRIGYCVIETNEFDRFRSFQPLAVYRLLGANRRVSHRPMNP